MWQRYREAVKAESDGQISVSPFQERQTFSWRDMSGSVDVKFHFITDHLECGKVFHYSLFSCQRGNRLWCSEEPGSSGLSGTCWCVKEKSKKVFESYFQWKLSHWTFYKPHSPDQLSINQSWRALKKTCQWGKKSALVQETKPVKFSYLDVRYFHSLKAT